jgi:CDP-glucose 4,6-dehydratase
MGTVHVLEAARGIPALRAIVCVTTDKCYENKEWVWGYRENEPMGGHDPYSSSKGCAELVSAAYRASFFDGRTGRARDRARRQRDRRRRLGGGPARPRYPAGVRDRPAGADPQPALHPPWQHVLEPLSGYLARRGLVERGGDVTEGWNFGPREEDARPVQWIVERMVESWGGGAHWVRDEAYHPHEARYLKLDTSKARERLGWKPRWTLEETLDRIVGLAQDEKRAEIVRLAREYFDARRSLPSSRGDLHPPPAR